MKKIFLFLLLIPFVSFGQETVFDSFYGTASGSNSYSVTIPAVNVTAAYAGQRLSIKYTNANSGSSTLKVNNFPAKGITKNGSNLSSGAITTGVYYFMIYDGVTQKWQLTGNSSGGGGSGTVTSVGITSADNSVIINSGSPVTSSGSIDLTSNAFFQTNGAPTVNDDNTNGHFATQQWFDLNTGILYEAFNVGTGTATWITIYDPTVSSGWNLTGNSGTNSATNFIGTTDAVDVTVSRNGNGYDQSNLRLQSCTSILSSGCGDSIILGGGVPDIHIHEATGGKIDMGGGNINITSTNSAAITLQTNGTIINQSDSIIILGQLSGSAGIYISSISTVKKISIIQDTISNNGNVYIIDGTQGANKVPMDDGNGNGLLTYRPSTFTGPDTIETTSDVNAKIAAIPLWDTTQCLNGINVHGITSCTPLNLNADSVVSTGLISAPSLRVSGLSSPNNKIATYDADGNITATATSSLAGLATVATSGSYNDLSNQPTIPAASKFVQIAHATGVNGAALASTTLTYEAGVALSTHIPTFAVIKYASGTLGIAVVILNANGMAASASLAIVGLTSSNWAIMPVIAGVMSNTGNLTIQVTTASVGASTFDVAVYGIQY